MRSDNMPGAKAVAELKSSEEIALKGDHENERRGGEDHQSPLRQHIRVKTCSATPLSEGATSSSLAMALRTRPTASRSKAKVDGSWLAVQPDEPQQASHSVDEPDCTGRSCQRADDEQGPVVLLCPAHDEGDAPDEPDDPTIGPAPSGMPSHPGRTPHVRKVLSGLRARPEFGS